MNYNKYLNIGICLSGIIVGMGIGEALWYHPSISVPSQPVSITDTVVVYRDFPKGWVYIIREGEDIVDSLKVEAIYIGSKDVVNGEYEERRYPDDGFSFSYSWSFSAPKWSRNISDCYGTYAAARDALCRIIKAKKETLILEYDEKLRSVCE